MRKEKSVSQNKSNIPDIDVIDLDNDILEDDKGLLNEELPAEKFSVRTLFKKRKHLIPDLLWMALAAFTSLIIVFFVYKMWKRDITCPIVYYQDGVGGLLSIKNISDGNGFFHFPSLRAPYGEYNYNQDYILPLIIISIFSIFTKSVGALSNLFWLSTYFFTACTAYAFQIGRAHV